VSSANGQSGPVKDYGEDKGIHVTKTGLSDGGKFDATHPQVKEYGGGTPHKMQSAPPPVFAGQHVTEYGAASGMNKSTSADNSVNLGAYLNELEGKINGRSPQKFLGQVIINFRILKDGSITGLKLVRSSGMQQIDATALDAIKSSAPFAPISSGVAKDVQYTFDSTSAGTRGHGIFK